MLIIGICMIGVLLALILSKKMSALSALILVPIVGGLIAGFGWQTFEFAAEGMKSISPVVAMFIFAILFFGILSDAGMFEPIINGILNRVGTNPVLIAIGTAILTIAVHFDGSGASTFLIAIPAMLPLYDRLKLDRLVLACIVSLSAGTMNMVPWGGPTIRAASALDASVTQLYTPMILPQLIGLLFVIVVAARLGHKEAVRIALDPNQNLNLELERTNSDKSLQRPSLFGWNLLLGVIALGAMISGRIPPAIVFMLATIFVLLLNYPDIDMQKKRVLYHAEAAIHMAAILFAAGIFTGVLKESGILESMASEMVQVIPQGIGPYLPVSLAVCSMPLSFVFDPNSFYFGLLPVLAEAGSAYGIEPVTMGQAAILGQMTTGFPLSPLTASTFLLIGLAKVDLADHQRFTFKYAFMTTLVMTIVAVLVGVIPV